MDNTEVVCRETHTGQPGAKGKGEKEKSPPSVWGKREEDLWYLTASQEMGFGSGWWLCGCQCLTNCCRKDLASALAMKKAAPDSVKFSISSLGWGGNEESRKQLQCLIGPNSWVSASPAPPSVTAHSLQKQTTLMITSDTWQITDLPKYAQGP